MANAALIGEAKILATRCRRALSTALGDVPRVRGSHYVIDVADNLVGCSPEDIQAEFEAGGGRELKRKMRAPWSSSGLCVNSFCRWRREQALYQLSLAAMTGFDELRFERTFKHGIIGPPPHLDAELLGAPTLGSVAIESKCLEPVDISLKEDYEVSAQYLDLEDERRESAWYAVLEQVKTFVFLDAFQLVKHYLGFVRSGKQGPKTLVYLYWQPNDPDHEVFARHREEVGRFSRLVDGDPTCAFYSSDYAQLWSRLECQPDQPPWLPDHLRALRTRYAIELGV